MMVGILFVAALYSQCDVIMCSMFVSVTPGGTAAGVSMLQGPSGKLLLQATGVCVGGGGHFITSLLS
jgi:hypothetical protein